MEPGICRLGIISRQNENNKTYINKKHRFTIDNLIEHINKAAEETIDVRKYNGKKRYTAWWIKQCEEATRNRRTALNRYKKQRTTENLINFKKMRAIARITIKNSKKASWHKFVSSFTTETSTKSVWNKIRKSNQTITSIQPQP